MLIIPRRWQEELDKTVQDYLVSLRHKDMSEDDKKKNLQWAQDFVSMALSNIGSQVIKTGFKQYSNVCRVCFNL